MGRVTACGANLQGFCKISRRAILEVAQRRWTAKGKDMRSFKFRWRRWVAGALGLVALYAVAGFWLVPFLVKDQLPKIAQAQLARQASVADVEFNPFTLRLAARDLRLAEADGAPLLRLDALDVEFQWRSLVQRAWSFAAIRLTAPRANLVISPEGRFNLADLLDTINRQPRDEKETGLPRLVIDHFALEQGKVEMHDRRAGYDNVFEPIAFTLTDFSTLPGEADTHTFSAQSARGGKVHWKGTATVDPIRGSGELTLENVSLPEVSVYLRSYTTARIAAGKLSATLPYRFSYADGRFEAALAGAKLALGDLALAREGASDAFAALTRLQVDGVDADLARREATVAGVRAEGGRLAVRRDARGELDLARLMVAAAGRAAAAPAQREFAVDAWKLAVNQVLLDDLALAAVDETVSPPARLDARRLRLQLQATAQQTGADLQVKLAEMAFSAHDLVFASGKQTPIRLAQAGFSDGTLDLAARRAMLGRVHVQGGQLQLTRNAKGELDLLGLLPKFASAPAAAPVADSGPPWSAMATSVDLAKFSADVHDQASGVKVRVNDLAVKLAGASTDLKQPVKFDASLSLREGGQLSAQGSVVPGTGALQAAVRVRQLALAPLQPLLAQHLKLKIAGGNVSAQGRITGATGKNGAASLRYAGGLNVAGLALNEVDGDAFASWQDVRADSFTASLNPNRLDIPELRVVAPNAKLIIEDDRSLNAARLLVRPAAQPAPAAATAARGDEDPFPVRVRRVRVQDAKLDFTDLSLRPQFAAKIYELNGVINGLSSSRQSRSQVELDGRVDEFGLARVRGELNPFAPADNTDVNVVFRNVDMVPTSPYAMKFAGYRIAEGKISLDLQYKVRGRQLAGENQIVIDKLTLGERVDSPDALKLPLELAIALLKDSDGRIDLGLPVSGNLDDPQFSYGALIWKAIGTVLTKIVTAPFRAIGALLGISGEKLEGIAFDPGSDRLLPPEREKLKQIAQLLARRPQLRLSVPGHYSEAADGAAMRARAVRMEIARRAGVKLQPGEEPGPVDLGSRSMRSAVRELYAARFGEADLDREKKAAEAVAPAPVPAASAGAAKAPAAQDRLPLLQRVGKMIQGEPQVADASAFYGKLIGRLNREQPLASGALAQLGTHRADTVLTALKESGVDPARAVAGAPEQVEASAGKEVTLKLALGAR